MRVLVCAHVRACVCGHLHMHTHLHFLEYAGLDMCPPWFENFDVQMQVKKASPVLTVGSESWPRALPGHLREQLQIFRTSLATL
jgi:hypothetical protein